jgi:putative addiction module killer protein
MIEIRKTDVFEKWFSNLTDRLAQRRIQVRIDRLGLGNAGDAKLLGDGVSEMRIDHGPGYRVYFTRRGSAIVILLAGGDKRTQQRDIDTAVDLAKRL